MKKTYTAPSVETITLMVEDAILSISGEEKGIDIKDGSVGAGGSLSNNRIWGNSGMWDND